MNTETLQRAKTLETEILKERESINAIESIKFYRSPFLFKGKTTSRIMHYFYGATSWDISLTDMDLDFLLLNKNNRVLSLEKELELLS